jgi:hypothetical protein
MTPITSTQLIAIITDALKDAGTFEVAYSNIEEQLLEHCDERRAYPVVHLPDLWTCQQAADAIADLVTANYLWKTGDSEVREQAESLKGWQLPEHNVVIWERDDQMHVWLGNDRDFDMDYIGKAELP